MKKKWIIGIVLLALIVLSVIIFYSKEKVLPSPADSLVAYYPFDGDSFDYQFDKDVKLYGPEYVPNEKSGFGQALSFDGIDDFFQVYEKIYPEDLADKEAHPNPLLPGKFGSVWVYEDNIYLFYASSANFGIYVASSPLDDKYNFGPSTLIVPKGDYEFDKNGFGGVGNVWEENGRWNMFTRTARSSTVNGFGYIYCDTGLECLTGPDNWVKGEESLINEEDGLFANDYDAFGLIKVGETYHLYANPSRYINHYTSEDLFTWESDPQNPLFVDNRYSDDVFFYNDYYYMFLPHDFFGFDLLSGIWNEHSFEVYRSPTPNFSPEEREYLGPIILNDKDYDRYYIDTPTCLYDNINKDTFPTGDELFCYYNGLSSPNGGHKHSSFNISFDKLENLRVRKEGFDFGEDFSISMWIKPKDFWDLSHRYLFVTNYGMMSYPDAGKGIFLYIYNDELRFGIGDNMGGTQSFNLKDDNWYHVTAVHEGSTDTDYIYINGEEEYKGIGKGEDYIHNAMMRGGRRLESYSPKYSFSGIMDEFRVFNKALDPLEAQEVYNLIPGSCIEGNTQQCGTTDIGSCEYGIETCTGGAWGSCIGNIEPVTEICDDIIDNDCDTNSDCDDTDCSGFAGCDIPPPTKTLLAYYQFEDNLIDEIGLNNGNNFGVLFTDSKTGFGKAARFNGTNYVEIPSSTNLDVGEDYSIAMWVNPNAVSGWQALFERGVSSSSRILLWLNGDEVTTGTNNYWSTSSANLIAGEWAHLVSVHDGPEDTEKIYVDGSLIQTGTGKTSDSLNTGNLIIGANRDLSYKFSGLIDEVKYYDGALSDSEVLELYESEPITGDCTFDEDCADDGKYCSDEVCNSQVCEINNLCPEDIDNDYCVSLSEITSYINNWLAGTSGTLTEVVNAMNNWLTGTSSC